MSICCLNPALKLFFSFVFSEQIKVSVNDFIIKAAAVTLKVSIVHLFIFTWLSPGDVYIYSTHGYSPYMPTSIWSFGA